MSLRILKGCLKGYLKDVFKRIYLHKKHIKNISIYIERILYNGYHDIMDITKQYLYKEKT